MYHIDWYPDRGGVADADLFVGGEGSDHRPLGGSSSDENTVLEGEGTGRVISFVFMRRCSSNWAYERELDSSSRGVCKRDP